MREVLVCWKENDLGEESEDFPAGLVDSTVHCQGAKALAKPRSDVPRRAEDVPLKDPPGESEVHPHITFPIKIQGQQ